MESVQSVQQQQQQQSVQSVQQQQQSVQSVQQHSSGVIRPTTVASSQQLQNRSIIGKGK